MLLIFYHYYSSCSKSIRIQCTPQELAVLLPAFNKIAQAFEPVEKSEEVGFSSAILNDVIATLPRLREPIKGLLGAISLPKAREGKKDVLWTDIEKYPTLDEVKMVSFLCGVIRL